MDDQSPKGLEAMHGDASPDAPRNAETRQAHRSFSGIGPDDAFSGASGVLFEQAMAQTRMAICLSDPRQKDAPIVFANRAFIALTGYDEDEIVGQNCRFLQGADTDPAKVQQIRRALEDEDVVVVELLNYRKDGSSFWNALHIGPIYDGDGALLYYFGSQWDVTDVHAARSGEQQAKTLSRELSHRMKNMFAVIGGIVNVTGRTRDIRPEAREINERIQALGRAYETTLDDASQGSVDVLPAIRSVLAPYDPDKERVTITGAEMRVEPTVLSTLGLTLHELATNAMKYGAWSTEHGHVDIALEAPEADRLVLRWKERGGPPVAEPPANKGSGIEITDTLLAASGSTVERDWNRDGLCATLRLRVYG